VFFDSRLVVVKRFFRIRLLLYFCYDSDSFLFFQQSLESSLHMRVYVESTSVTPAPKIACDEDL
jgi:hypothetical protein